MSNLYELIQLHCPNGVEYRSIGAVTKSISTGLNPRTNFVLNTSNAANYYVTTKEIVTGKIIFSEKTDLVDDQALSIIQKRSHLESDDILLSGIGTIGKVAVVDIPVGNWNCSESIFLLKPLKEIIIPRYLMHCLRSRHVQDSFLGKSRGSTLKGIRKGDLVSVEIPVPPIEVQQEIVRVLDELSGYEDELVAKLQEELKAREKQMEVYRDKLLNAQPDLQWIPIGELAKFSYGYTDKAKDSGNLRFVRITDIADNGSLKIEGAKYIEASVECDNYLLHEGDLLVARTGASYGKTLYVPSMEPAVYASFLIKITFGDSEVDSRYYWHFSKSEHYWKQARNLVSIGGQQQFNANALKKLLIPLPSIEIQREIVAKLDAYTEAHEALIANLREEIELRHVQYEYYRDALLSFKKKGA